MIPCNPLGAFRVHGSTLRTSVIPQSSPVASEKTHEVNGGTNNIYIYIYIYIHTYIHNSYKQINTQEHNEETQHHKQPKQTHEVTR